MSAPWTFLDAVLEQIDREVAAHPPERGGALLGPVGYPMVSHFALDGEARTTSTVYVPSLRITARVGAMEQAGTLELKGVLHSHPGLDRLSRQDERSFAGLLDLNPRMARCLAPIVTQRPPVAEHEVGLPSGKLSCYCITRTRRGPVVERASATVLPVLEVAEGVARSVLARRVELVGPSTTFGPLTVDVLLTESDLGDVVLAFPLAFPLVGPAVLVEGAGRPARLVPVSWRPGVPSIPQIVAAIAAARRPSVAALPIGIPRRNRAWI